MAFFGFPAPLRTEATAWPAGAALNSWVSALSSDVLTGQLSSYWSTWNSDAAQLGARDNPNQIPPPGQILAAYHGGILTLDEADFALRQQGIPWGINPAGRPINNILPRNGIWSSDKWRYRSGLWGAVSEMTLARPSPEFVATLAAQGRLTQNAFSRLKFAVPAAWEKYAEAIRAATKIPDEAALHQLWRLGLISRDAFFASLKSNGWYQDSAIAMQQAVSALPSVYELLLAGWRGLPQEDMDRYRKALGFVNDESWDIFQNANKPLPGPSDLVRFAIREAWDEDTARAWGYDDEFPEPFRRWMQWYGQDWGEAFVGSDGRQYPNVPWPKAYWRAHWQIMAPTQAYRALHLLRPDQIARYRELSPGVTPFTVQDMTRVLKVSDYPPKMRAWLQAIAFTPMRLVDIRQTYRLGVRDRQWAVNRLLDRGAVREDANTTLDLWDRQNEPDLQAMLNAFRKRFTLERVAENRAAYAIGGISRDAAINNMSGLGLPQPLILQVLAFEDSRQARKQLTGFISQMRRSYLTGSLSDAEVAQSLSAANIAAPAIQRYLRLWQSELGIERRSLSTSQVVAAVASGALPPAVAAVRLARLGWTQPDIALQIQQALAKLVRAQASAAQKVAATQKQAARDLQAAQRQAQAAQRFAQNQLRRIYPVGTLKRWYCLGIRKGPTISALLLSQGYTADSARDLLKEWAIECQTSPKATEPAVVESQALVRRQTPLSTIKQWFQNGVYSESETRERLSLSGYSPDNVSRYIQLWQSTLGKKSGPAPEGAAQTQP